VLSCFTFLKVVIRMLAVSSMEIDGGDRWLKKKLRREYEL
jgi:hypothetical protein